MNNEMLITVETITGEDMSPVQLKAQVNLADILDDSKEVIDILMQYGLEMAVAADEKL